MKNNPKKNKNSLTNSSKKLVQRFKDTLRETESNIKEIYAEVKRTGFSKMTPLATGLIIFALVVMIIFIYLIFQIDY